MDTICSRVSAPIECNAHVPAIQGVTTGALIAHTHRRSPTTGGPVEPSRLPYNCDYSRQATSRKAVRHRLCRRWRRTQMASAAESIMFPGFPIYSRSEAAAHSLELLSRTATFRNKTIR
jgi:hypothetical protein